MLNVNQNKNHGKSMFSNLTKVLNFEDDKVKNIENQNVAFEQENNNTDESKDAQLDADLDELRGNNQSSGENDDSESVSTDNSDSSNSPEGGDPSAGDDMGGFDNNNGSSGDLSGDTNGDSGSGFGDDETNEPELNKVNRKLTLYSEYNRVYNSVKRSVESLTDIVTDNADIKSCVAQLQAVLSDMSFVMTSFGSRTEDDIEIHFAIIKERIQVIEEQLKRYKAKKDDENRKKEEEASKKSEL